MGIIMHKGVAYGGGGIDAIADASDVDLTSPADGQFLKYDGTAEKWVNAPISAVYHAAGSKTVSQLVSALLIADNEGCVYNMSDSGETTSDFVEGEGYPIREGDNVGIVNVGTVSNPVYKFDLLSGFVDLSDYYDSEAVDDLLADKADTADLGDLASIDIDGSGSTKYLRGDGTWQAFPTIPTVNNGTLTIQKNGTTVATFTANQSGNSNANINVPTQPSDIDAAAESDIESTKTTSGNPITITDAAPINAEKLEVVLEPKQDLHGYDFPWVGGAHYNKWDEEWEVGMLVDNGVVNINATERRTTSFIPVEPNTEYYSSSGYVLSGRVAYYDGNKNCIYFSASGLQTQRFTTPNNAYFMRITLVSSYGTTYNHDIAINYPSSITTYSPWENICPISGYDEVEVDDVGKNLFNKDATPYSAEHYISGSVVGGNIVTIGNSNYSVYKVAVIPNTTYTFGLIKANTPEWALTDANGVVTQKDSNNGGTSGVNITIQTGTNDAFLYLSVGVSGTYKCDDILQLEKGQTATQYEPFQSTTTSITFGQTVYGGKSDFVMGGTDETKNRIEVLSSWNWVKSSSYPGAFYTQAGATLKANTPFICTHGKTVTSLSEYVYGTVYCDYSLNFRLMQEGSEIQDWKDFLDEQSANGTPVCICGELVTPIKLSTPPAPLPLLKGTNNLSTDGTSMTVGYQPNNVIGELKADLENAVQKSEMGWRLAYILTDGQELTLDETKYGEMMLCIFSLSANTFRQSNIYPTDSLGISRYWVYGESVSSSVYAYVSADRTVVIHNAGYLYVYVRG